MGWRIAPDSDMRHVVRRGRALASAGLAHSGHVEVEGLRSGRDYYYQFDAGSDESPIGHFRTAPAPDEVEMPAFFRRALAEKDKTREGFERLAPSYRQRYIVWLATAKRPETQEKRYREAISLLERGEKLGLK